MPTVETVTILITDLVGSTSLESRIGPAAADELRHEHFRVLRSAIDAASGEEVKSTGDGLVAVFRGVADAVACSVSIQQRMERRNRNAEEKLAIRAGIALGDATCEDGDYFGMPVVEAARLCDRAAGGQILTTELVRMVGGRHGHPFKPVGALRLKGFPEPLPAYDVAWESLERADGEIPLPPRLRRMPSAGFVGRTKERERVKTLWGAACSSQRQALLVAGEPGIGKTRLTADVAREFHGDRACVLFGSCPEELGAPFAVWIQALSHFVEHAPDHLLRSHVERHGGELGRLVPALARRLPDASTPVQTDPETERYLFFSAVVDLLRHASLESPLFLGLDDLHWADRPALALLKHVITELRDAPVLVIGTYRDSDLSRKHPLTDLLADLRREEGTQRLTLRGLAEPEVVAVIEVAAGHGIAGAGVLLARQIAAETDGNPFFVEEILRHLSEMEALTQTADGRWEVTKELDELGLPQSVREVVSRRVERLGEDCRAVLSTAAVIGREFDVGLLLSIVPQEEDELIDLLETAVEASLLEECADQTGVFSFSHNLINHTLYDALGATRRSRIHRRVAEALEEICDGDPGARAAELARHWTAATAPVDLSKAVAYSRRAGDNALAELAPDEAVSWFEQGLELLERAQGDDRQRCDLMIGLGEAQRQIGEPGFRETLLYAARLAEQRGDAERMARAALANNRGFASTFGVVDEERLQALERAIELRDSFEPALCARLLSLQAMELQFDPDHERRRGLADAALGVARDSGDIRILPYVLRDHFHATWSADTLPARRQTAAEMEDLADRVDDPLARIWALDRTIHAAVESGEMTAAIEASERLLKATEELGQPGLRWHATYYAAGLAQMMGNLEEADRLAVGAFRLGEAAREPDAAMVYLGQLCTVRSNQGRAAEVLDTLEQATRANPGIPAFEAGFAAALCDTGGEVEAATRLERAADCGFRDVPLDQVYSSALACWARTAADVEDERAAASLYDLIEPWRDRFVWNGAHGYGSAESYLGMLAATLDSHDRAAEHFATASTRHQREGVMGWEAQNLCYWARSLLASGSPEDARAKAEQSISLGRENGYGSSVRQAEALLALSSTV